MLNPLDVEQRFQDLLFTLSYPCPVLQRLNAMDAFLAHLGEEAPAYESYVLDCARHFTVQARLLQTSGFAPERVQPLMIRWLYRSFSMQALERVEGLPAALKEFRLLIAGLYAFVGDEKSIMRVLCLPSSKGIPPWWKDDSASAGVAPFEKLESLTEHADTAGDPISGDLRILQSRWQTFLEAGRDSAYVPVIERSIVGGTDDILASSLRRFTVQIIGDGVDGKDDVHSDIVAHGSAEESGRMWDIPLRAARRLIAVTNPRFGERCVSVRVSLGAKDSLYEGRSANLAVAALFAIAFHRRAVDRSQFRILPSAAISGDIDSEGRVVPIDPNSLQQKVEAVFYSHVQTLAVPKEQELQAAEAVAALTSRLPRRSLDTVGVKHVRELFFDRRVIEEVRTPLAVHAVRRAWRRKYPIIAAAAILVLSGILGRLVYGPLDRNPTQLSFQGEMMLVKNRFGQVLTEVSVGMNTVSAQNDTISFRDFDLKWALTDADGDRINEAFFVRRVSEGHLESDQLQAWSYSIRDYLWQQRFQPLLDFPNKPDAKGSSYAYTKILPTDFGRGGRSILLLSMTHATSFPSFLREVDLETGTSLAEYLHVGHIIDFILIDLNNDGSKEIVMCGINNAFRAIFVAVLNSRLIAGCSPTTVEYVCASHPPASEMYYLLIPRTIVGESGSRRTKNGSPRGIEWNSIERRLTIDVDDASGGAEGPGRLSTASLTYVFSDSLRLVTSSQGDDFELVSEHLAKLGVIRKKPDWRYFETLKRKIKYWDGGKWVSEPRMNKQYIQASKKLEPSNSAPPY